MSQVCHSIKETAVGVVGKDKSAHSVFGSFLHSSDDVRKTLREQLAF